MAQAACILYVEDNLENRTLIKRVLEIEGYRVVEAADGLTGVQKAEAVSPDLILMDINLPDVDGYEATARIRKLPALASVPVVALTANVLEGDRQRALASGCNGYIPKPIDVDELPRQVKSYLSSGAQPPAERLSGERLNPERLVVQPAAQPAPGQPSAPAPPLPALPPGAPSARRGVRVVKVRTRLKKLPQTGQLPQR